MKAGEILNILDEDGNVLATISREEAERDNHLTENALVFLFNSKGEVWAQLRPKNKKHYPGVWDISACGGVVSGEDPADSARRETVEETGLAVELHEWETFLNVFPGENGEERKRLSHLYIGFTDEIPQPTEEAEAYKVWQPKELRADILTNPSKYVPSFEFELDKALKAYKKFKSSTT